MIKFSDGAYYRQGSPAPFKYAIHFDCHTWTEAIVLVYAVESAS